MNRQSLSFLFGLVKKNKRSYLGAMVCTIFTVIISFITPLIFAETIDTVLAGRPTTLPEFFVAPVRALGGLPFLQRNLWVIGLVLVFINVISGVFSYLKGRLTAVASESIAYDLRDKLYAHLEHLPFSYHVKAVTGDLLQRCTSDVETVRRFLSVQLIEVVNTLLMIVICTVILLQKNVKITLLSVVLVPILFTFALVFFKRVTHHFKIMDESEGALSAVLQENLTGVRVVRAFGQQQREVEKMDVASSDFRGKAYKVIYLLALYWSGGDALSILQSLITLIVCIYFAIQGEITIGTMTIFTSYVGMLLFPIRQLGRILSDMGKSLVSTGRIRDILDTPVEPDEPDAKKPGLKGDIVFDHVSFSYEDGREILKDVSFHIKAGKTVAVLGGTGSGKSTLVHLLQRLFPVTQGEVSISGVPVQEIDRKYLRSRVGLILQEPFLFSKTIEENLGIAMRQYTHEEIEHAASIAGARDFIERSDKGYETLVGEKGVTLSGGQKQRIAIARTLMKENDILIFDDSLSAVDTQTDAQIRAALKDKQKGVTTIIISHRITTLQEADYILVLEDGRLTAQGNHQELIAKPGLYQRINHIQTDLEQELMQTGQDEKEAV